MHMFNLYTSDEDITDIFDLLDSNQDSYIDQDERLPANFTVVDFNENEVVSYKELQYYLDRVITDQEREVFENEVLQIIVNNFDYMSADPKIQ